LATPFGGKINFDGFHGGAMFNEASIANDVLIDLSGLAHADLSEYGDSNLVRALRRFLAAGKEADVIADWNEGI
jgi:hypothetical protein